MIRHRDPRQRVFHTADEWDSGAHRQPDQPASYGSEVAKELRRHLRPRIVGVVNGGTVIRDRRVLK